MVPAPVCPRRSAFYTACAHQTCFWVPIRFTLRLPRQGRYPLKTRPTAVVQHRLTTTPAGLRRGAVASRLRVRTAFLGDCFRTGDVRQRIELLQPDDQTMLALLLVTRHPVNDNDGAHDAAEEDACYQTDQVPVHGASFCGATRRRPVYALSCTFNQNGRHQERINCGP